MSAGVLLPADVHGATRENLARHRGQAGSAQLAGRINLPILHPVLNYAHHSLEELCHTAASGGGQQDWE